MSDSNHIDVRFDGPSQPDLFSPHDDQQDQRTARLSTQRKFIDPDPTQIWVRGQRLDEYLKVVDSTDALMVREMLSRQDFSQFRASYAPCGRAPYAPRAMLGLIVWGLFNGVTSLRALEKKARLDFSYMWVSGGIQPDHSIIGRFIQRHTKLLNSGEFLVELTRQIMEICDSDPSQVAGDGTVIEAVASRYELWSQQAAEQRAEELAEQAEQNPDDDELKSRSQRAQKAAKNVRERAEKRKVKGKDPSKAVIAESDPDAYVQRLKRTGTAPSYKPSILANKDRFITGCAVDPSSEKRVIDRLIMQTEKVSEEGIARLMLDGNYFATSILQTAVDHNIDLLVPDGKFDKSPTEKTSSNGKKFHKNQFKYDAIRDVFICPAGQALKRQYRSTTTDGRKFVRYGGAPCDSCALRSQCTEAKNGRTVKRCEGDDLKEAQRQVMSQPRARSTYRKRQGWVEPVFSELRGVQRLQRFHRRGLEAVNAEFMLHAIAHNLRRMTRVLYAKRDSAAHFGLFSVFCMLLTVLTQLFIALMWFRVERVLQPATTQVCSPVNCAG